jgi:superfamily II helicase
MLAAGFAGATILSTKSRRKALKLYTALRGTGARLQRQGA